MEQLWSQLVTDETSASSRVLAVRNDNVAQAILALAAETDLVVLGLNRPDPRRRVFGPLTTRLVQDISSAVMVIGQQG
jgi:nucleotide-binding universal stress UspA family protein